MNVRLVLERGRRRVWTAELRGAEATLGRAVGSTVRVPSAEVSRLHCRLTMEDGLLQVEDLESVNGTFLNGSRVRGKEFVRPGDHLGVGPITFVVEYELTPSALERLRADIPELEVLDSEEEVPVLQPADDAPIPADDDLVAPEELDEGGREYVLDESDSLHLPDAGELRDILLELEDDTKDRGRKRKK